MDRSEISSELKSSSGTLAARSRRQGLEAGVTCEVVRVRNMALMGR